MAEIIARFADGRLLIQEERLVETLYTSGGVAVRIGLVKEVTKILSLEAFISGYPQDGRLLVPIKDALVSGDTILMLLRRTDVGEQVMTGLFSGVAGDGNLIISGFAGGILSGMITLTGPIGSGTAALGYLSGLTSGLRQYQELASGVLFISGRLNVIANVVAIP